jgi:hypothetical protein
MSQMPCHCYLLSYYTSCSGSSLLAALPITYLSPSTHSLTALLPRRIRVFEARQPAHVAHAQLAAAAHEQRVVGSVAHRVEHLLAVAWGAVGVMVGARTRRGGEGRVGRVSPMCACIRGDNWGARQLRAWRGYGEHGDASRDRLPYGLVAARADDAGAL